MGGGQSQERVVSLEEGEAEITVTEDFLQYVSDQQGGPQEEKRAPPSCPSEPEEVPPFVSAEELLMGESSAPLTSKSDDSKWKQKYEREKSKNEDFKHFTSKEYSDAVAEVRDKFAQTSLHNLVPVCEEYKDCVLDCYHSNPNRTLECSSEVKEYVECVQRAKNRLLQTSQNSSE